MKKRAIIPVIFLFAIASTALAQKMTVKDSDSNVLMEVNDEGVIGSITLPSGNAPVTTTDKLYNVGGTLYWNGSSVATGSGLTLPYSGSTSSGSDAFYVTTTGTGRSGYFRVNNSGNSSDALYAETDGTGRAVFGLTSGTGRAGQFGITNVSNSNDALYVVTYGTGRAGYFNTSNASNINSALYAVTSYGSGNSVEGENAGTGIAGEFKINNVSNGSAALYANTNGTGVAGEFRIDNASNSNNALVVRTNGTGGALKVNHTGSSGYIAAFQNSGSNKVTIDRDGDGWFAGKVDVGTFFNLTQQSGVQIPDGSDAITVTTSHVLLGSAEMNDPLDTIYGASFEGQLLILVGQSVSNNVSVKEEFGGNIRLDSGATFNMNENDILMLMYVGTKWLEISRSDN